MSVINQMLKDLDKRSSDEKRYSASYRPTPEQVQHGPWKLILRLLAALLISIAIWYWLTLDTSSTSPIVVDSQLVQPVPESVEPKVVSVSESKISEPSNNSSNVQDESTDGTDVRIATVTSKAEVGTVDEDKVTTQEKDEGNVTERALPEPSVQATKMQESVVASAEVSAPRSSSSTAEESGASKADTSPDKAATTEARSVAKHINDKGQPETDSTTPQKNNVQEVEKSSGSVSTSGLAATSPAKDTRTQKASVVSKTASIQVDRVVEDDANFSVAVDKGVTPETQAAQLQEQAKRLLAQGRPMLAVKHYEKLLSLTPDDHVSRLQAVALLERSGQTEKATALLQDAVVAYPDNGRYWRRLAQLMSNNDPRQAFDMIRELRPEFAQYSGFYAFRASLARQLQENTIAVQDYYRLIDAQPNEPRWLMGIGLVLEQQGNNERALAYYRDAVSKPGLPRAARDYLMSRITAMEN